MNRSELQILFSRRERPDSSVLTVYLNVDQSQQANLNRGFETQLKTMLSSVRNSSIEEPAERDRFAKAARHITDFISVYKPEARGLVLFLDEADGFFWHTETDFPLENQARWGTELYLRPLANAFDQFEHYGVVLVDRAHMRLFTVFLNQIENIAHEKFETGRVRHIKSVGTDHIESASQVQRKADQQVRSNLRRVVQAVDVLVHSKRLNRLVLAGTPENTALLINLLPKRLSSRVIARTDIAADAPAADVLAATREIAADFERNSELRTVNDVVTAAAKKQRAVIGLSHTLTAVNSDRIWQLIYSEGFASPGFECRKCTALFSVERSTCPNCGAEVQPVRNVVERAVEHAFRNGARIEVVTGEAAATLESSGGIGGYLKARTNTIQV
jgi:peptide subunit release factor 1 (eRF1)